MPQHLVQDKQGRVAVLVVLLLQPQTKQQNTANLQITSKGKGSAGERQADRQIEWRREDTRHTTQDTHTRADTLTMCFCAWMMLCLRVCGLDESATSTEESVAAAVATHCALPSNVPLAGLNDSPDVAPMWRSATPNMTISMCTWFTSSAHTYTRNPAREKEEEERERRRVSE